MNMKQRIAVRFREMVPVWICLLAAFAFSVPARSATEPSSRPNVLFLFTDDQRHDTIRALGNDWIRTPNMDRLVHEGVTFRNAFIMGGSSPAVCSPSRACLFSGRTLWNVDCQGEYGFEIPERFKTLPQVFRENGYATFGTGKNEPGRAGAFGRSFSAGDKILYDIYPTLCERAGLETPDTVQFRSLNDIIRDPGAPSRDHLYFAFMSWQRAVRDKQFKLIEYCVNNERHTQLFDLRNDPQETRNLAADEAFAGTLARLRKLLREDRASLNDGSTPFPFSNRQGQEFWAAYESADR